MAKVSVKDAIEPICDRLTNSNLQEIDLIVSLLDYLDKLNSELPQDLLQYLSFDDVSWQIKTKLEKQYLSAKF